MAADTGAAISSAGARRGYGITAGGYNQAVVSSVGHNIARDIEQGMTLRY